MYVKRGKYYKSSDVLSCYGRIWSIKCAGCLGESKLARGFKCTTCSLLELCCSQLMEVCYWQRQKESQWQQTKSSKTLPFLRLDGGNGPWAWWVVTTALLLKHDPCVQIPHRSDAKTAVILWHFSWEREQTCSVLIFPFFRQKQLNWLWNKGFDYRLSDVIFTLMSFYGVVASLLICTGVRTIGLCVFQAVTPIMFCVKKETQSNNIKGK